jgi:hypothetical protein
VLGSFSDGLLCDGGSDLSSAMAAALLPQAREG